MNRGWLNKQLKWTCPRHQICIWRAHSPAPRINLRRTAATSPLHPQNLPAGSHPATRDSPCQWRAHTSRPLIPASPTRDTPLIPSSYKPTQTKLLAHPHPPPIANQTPPHARPRARQGQTTSRSNGRPHRLHRHHHRLRRQATPIPLAGAPLRLLLRVRGQRQHHPVAVRLHQDLLRRPGALVRAALLRRHLPAARGRRHRRPDPVQGVQGLRQAREAVRQEAQLVAQEVRAGLGARARHPGHHREDQAPVRELRQVRPALRLRRPAPPHRQRRPAALGRVHHPRRALPLHRRLDRVGRPELPHRRKRREEARHEGDHHRRRARLQDHPQGLHLARRRLPRVDQRRPRRRRRRHRLLISGHACVHGWLVSPKSDGQRRRGCGVDLCGLGVGADRIMEKWKLSCI